MNRSQNRSRRRASLGTLALEVSAFRAARDTFLGLASVAGIAGALVAVPLVAALNAVAQHLAAHTAPGSDPEEELAEDYQETGEIEPLPDAGDVEVPAGDVDRADDRA